ncbi:MAG TPA: prolipoprotein diacylglyceryl transferase family protein [Solirubrobacteraceae bacterium]|nr:prolipoprotein diacylglyceryl transferase family protein [Solirubrobacteraceae bacterium]
METAVLKIGIDPTIDLGPVTLAWHGLTIALGVLLGGLVAGREARRRGLDPAPLQWIGIILIVGALVGGRVYFLAEHGDLLDPGAWLGTQGFTFYGGFIAAGLGIGAYLWRERLDVTYLDVVAIALPLGLAVGRVGDVILGEHYGPQSDFFLAVQNVHPEADVPRHDVAYHSGGLYEVFIGLIVFGIVWPLRTRLQRPTALMWTVLGLLAAGRFLEFFVRSDSATLAWGLETAQWTSVALMLLAAGGAWAAQRRPPNVPLGLSKPRER